MTHSFTPGQLIRRTSFSSYCWQVDALGNDISRDYIMVHPGDIAIYLHPDRIEEHSSDQQYGARRHFDDRDIILFKDIMLSADLTTSWELVGNPTGNSDY